MAWIKRNEENKIVDFLKRGEKPDDNWEEIASNSQEVIEFLSQDPASNGYAEWELNRIKGYGTVGEQLDMQYWDLVNGTTTWKDHIAAIKSQYPKPE